jgi:hypothetical protein
MRDSLPMPSTSGSQNERIRGSSLINALIKHLTQAVIVIVIVEYELNRLLSLSVFNVLVARCKMVLGISSITLRPSTATPKLTTCFHRKRTLKESTSLMTNSSFDWSEDKLDPTDEGLQSTNGVINLCSRRSSSQDNITTN